MSEQQKDLGNQANAELANRNTQLLAEAMARNKKLQELEERMAEMTRKAEEAEKTIASHKKDSEAWSALQEMIKQKNADIYKKDLVPYIEEINNDPELTTKMAPDACRFAEATMNSGDVKLTPVADFMITAAAHARQSRSRLEAANQKIKSLEEMVQGYESAAVNAHGKRSRVSGAELKREITSAPSVEPISATEAAPVAQSSGLEAAAALARMAPDQFTSRMASKTLPEGVEIGANPVLDAVFAAL